MANELEIVNGLNKVTQLGAKNVEGLCEIIRAVIIHEVACEATDKVGSKLKEAVLPIPEVCTLNVTFKRGKVDTVNVVLDKKFQEGLEKAVKTGESELMKKVESKLIENIKEKYNALA